MKISSGNVLKCGCSSPEFKLVFSFKTKPKKEKNFLNKKNYFREILECSNCGHMINIHKLNINNIYTKKYYNLTYKNKNILYDRFREIINLPYKKSDNKHRSNRVHLFLKNNFNKNQKKILDIGSGTGVFLYEMTKKGYNCVGIEKDNRYVEFNKNLYNLNVLNQDIFKMKKNKNFRFDLISCNKVLEHLKDPLKFLREFKKFKKKNTILYLEVPSVKARKKGKYTGEFGIEHYHIFSVSSFKNLISAAGFEVLKLNDIIEPSGKNSLITFVK